MDQDDANTDEILIAGNDPDVTPNQVIPYIPQTVTEDPRFPGVIFETMYADWRVVAYSVRPGLPANTPFDPFYYVVFSTGIDERFRADAIRRRRESRDL